MSDPTNTQGVPGPDEEADVASGGAPERLDEETTGGQSDDDSDED